MWGSALLGDEYDSPIEVDDILTKYKFDIVKKNRHIWKLGEHAFEE